jgi:hypothetical protein
MSLYRPSLWPWLGSLPFCKGGRILHQLGHIAFLLPAAVNMAGLLEQLPTSDCGESTTTMTSELADFWHLIMLLCNNCECANFLTHNFLRPTFLFNQPLRNTPDSDVIRART